MGWRRSPSYLEIRPDGGVVVVISDPKGDEIVWVLSAADGSIQWSASIGPREEYWFGIDRDGAVAVLSSGDDTGASTLTVLEPDGSVRWQRTTEEMLYTGTIDASGTLLLVSEGTNPAFDIATGERRWTLTAPNPISGTVAVSTGRVVYGLDDYGVFYAASD